MFYVSAIGGAVSLLFVLAFALTVPIAIPVVWIFVALIAPFLADGHNRKLRARAELMASGD